MIDERDDDFAGMLNRVRKAAGAEGPSPAGSREPAPAKKSSEGSYYSLIGLTVIFAITIGGIVGIAALSTWISRRMVAQGASADNGALRKRQLQQQRLKRYVVPTDTTISALEAGRLLYAVIKAGNDDPPLQWELPPEPRLATSECCPSARDAQRLFGSKGHWTTGVFPAARRGYSPDQRTFLRGVARNPSLVAFRRAARARAADIGSAAWAVPSDSQVSWAELPVLRYGGLRNAADANMAAAALDFAEGRQASAEQRLREVISVGFLLQAAARSVPEDAVAGQIVNGGRLALEALYVALDRVDDAATVSAKSDPAIAVSTANRRVRVSELEETLLRRIRDTTELTGIRWQLLLGPFSFLPCTSIRHAVFGPGAKYRTALAEFHSALVKSPSDERRFTMVVRGVPQMIDPLTGYKQRGTGRPEWADFAASVTRSRQLETCATLFRR